MRNQFLTTVAAFALSACASTQAQTPPPKPSTQSATHAAVTGSKPAHGEHAHGNMMSDSHMTRGGGMTCPMQTTCPMMLEGTKVQTADVEAGASLTFTTTGDVSALRERIHKMAEMHTRGCTEPEAHGHEAHGPSHDSK